eukprot:2962112-Amphidinium_carterae.2
MTTRLGKVCTLKAVMRDVGGLQHIPSSVMLYSCACRFPNQALAHKIKSPTLIIHGQQEL